MQRIETRSDKSIAFILGLVYGYRNAQFELKVLSLEEFREENHLEDRVYYINRQKGEVYECYREGTSHICVIREDKINGKVWLFVYKNKVK
ncbi:MAG: hypothetical protein ACK42C_02390 [Aquificaceae bacterium]|jgi:hypothetical protein|uniref:hypothetical protein n=1 Tax=Hydrogenobacter sp. Uz 6-8 TaxID=3384828 RepID=UPI00309D04AF